MQYTIPKVVTSEDLNQRSYVTFYYKGKRVREYNGKNLNKNINPNRCKSVAEKNQTIEQLRYELHKALEADKYPSIMYPDTALQVLTDNTLKSSAQELLKEALDSKLNSSLSKTYKRDLSDIHRQFIDFMSREELNGSMEGILTSRVQSFLAQFGSSGTYYMNKRRTLGVLFNVAGRIEDKQPKAVKTTQLRKSKARLHQNYDTEQLLPILNYLKCRYPKLHRCCLLTYGSWLRPHEEVRLLTKGNFKNDISEVHLSGAENKGGGVRVVYVPDYVREELVHILVNLQHDDNIFSLCNQPYNESYFNTQWSRAWSQMFKLGLIRKDQTIYSFRHTAAVATYKKTKDVYLLQKLLGHSTIVVTLKYLRTLGEFNSEELRQAAPTL